MKRTIFCIVYLLFLTFDLAAKEYNIVTYGAIADGKTLNSEKIQAAIDACYASGGGTVVIPEGRFVTGPFELKSNISLRFLPGSKLIASRHLADYPVAGHYYALGDIRPLIWADGCTNIRIEGPGEIDLNGLSFMDTTSYRSEMKIETTTEYTDAQKQEAVFNFLDRPNHQVFFHQCLDIQITDIMLYDSSFWTMILSECEGVIINRVRIKCHQQIPNSDGIHLTASRNVVISDCIIHTGDDCIAMTSITNPAQECCNIVVSNVVMSSRSAGFRIGFESGKVQDVCISNVTIGNTNRGFAIDAGKDGYVRDVQIGNVIVETKKFVGAWWGKGEPVVMAAHDGGMIDNIRIHDVISRTENSLVLYGDIRHVRLDHWSMSVRRSNNINNFKALYELTPGPYIASPDPNRHIPFLYAEGVEHLTVNGFAVRTDERQLDVRPVMRKVGHSRLSDVKIYKNNK